MQNLDEIEYNLSKNVYTCCHLILSIKNEMRTKSIIDFSEIDHVFRQSVYYPSIVGMLSAKVQMRQYWKMS